MTCLRLERFSLAVLLASQLLLVTLAFCPLAPSSTSASLSMLFYTRDNDDNPADAWNVLSQTEEWISQTLSKSNEESGRKGSSNNPYTRKEVVYDCETNSSGPMIVAGIFRRLADLRQQAVEAACNWRRTVVVVIPAAEDSLAPFPAFDLLINTVNQARRASRDFLTDAQLEASHDALHTDDDDEEEEEDNEKFSVSINCAHMHPQFGTKTPEQQLQELKDEPDEVDINYQRYQEMKMLARRSPYPSLVLEVRSTPTPDFSQAPPSIGTLRQQQQENGGAEADDKEENSGVTAKDILRLEALFGQTAATKSATEDSFYQALGQNLDEVAKHQPPTPLQLAQDWVAANDSNLRGATASFTESDTPDVDHAFAFVFTNLAMMAEHLDDDKDVKSDHYLVMPRFLSSAAVSCEKFVDSVEHLLACLPALRGKVRVAYFHPEHVVKERRSPVTILVLRWME